MNEKGRLSLSGLALGVSTAGLLGVSSNVLGDPPIPSYCWAGGPCSIGYVEPPPPPWPYQAEGVEGHFVYGTCTYDPSQNASPASCGCMGLGEGEWVEWSEHLGAWIPHYWAEWIFQPWQANPECVTFE